MDRKEIIGIIDACTSCGLHKNERVYPKGYEQSIFMVVDTTMEILGNEDSIEYKLLDTLFEKAGVDFYTSWKTSILKCKSDNVEDSHVQSCMKNIFNKELEYKQPRIVFVINDAYNLIGNYTDISFVKVISPKDVTNGTITEKAFMNQFDAKMINGIKDIRDKETFVNYHHHNQYSIRDGYGTELQIVNRLLDLKSPGFTLTNHGNINAHYRQYVESNKVGIKPVFGTEFYYNPMRDKIIPLINDKSKEATAERKALGSANTYHITVIAKNEAGYKGLIWLNNKAWFESFYRFPLMDFNLLKQLQGNVYVFSGCIAGYIPNHLFKGEDREAIKEALMFQKTFGNDFFIELMSTSYPAQKDVNSKLIDLADTMKLKTVITNDAHYVEEDDSSVHEALQLARNQNTYEDLNDPNATEKESNSNTEEESDTGEKKKKKNVFVFSEKDYYIKNIDDLYENVEVLGKEGRSSKVLRDSIRNVNDLFAKIKAFTFDSSVKLPKLSDDSQEHFLTLIKNGIERRGIVPDKTFLDRLELEIRTIIDSGYMDYFIVLEDIVKWAKEEFGQFSIGPGRGSAAGSLVNYLLNITDVNPLKYPMMMFERFLSPERPDYPDIDTDCIPHVRDAIIQYMIDKYGEDKVAPIGTFGTNKLRTALLDIMTVFSVDTHTKFEVTKHIPDKIPIDKDTKGNDIYGDPEELAISEIRKHYPPLDEVLKEYPEIERLAEKLRGQIRSVGQHAGGVILSSVNIKENIPLVRTSKGTYVTANTEGMAYHELSDLGYVKYDVLGVVVLKALDDANKLIKQTHGIDIDWHDIDELDPKYSPLYELTQKGDTYGIFQFSTPIAVHILKLMKASEFNDLVACNSIMRPGPLDMGMDKIYAKRKLLQEEYELTDNLEPILGETFGVILYQEQVMLICRKLADFTGLEANVFRKLLVKSLDKEAIQVYRQKLIDGLMDKGFSEDESITWWQNIESFARYGFNYSHSLSYSINSFRQLYQKYYYTIEFYTSMFNNEPIDKVPEIVANMSAFDARKYDPIKDEITETYSIRLNPPHIKNMNLNFEVSEDGKSINYGLGKIKYISEDKFNIMAENLTEEDLQSIRGILEKKFENITRAGNKRMTPVINKTVFQALVYSGCLDGYEDEEGNLIERNDIIDMYNEIAKLKSDKQVKRIEDVRDAQRLEEYYVGISPTKIEEELEYIKYCRTLSRRDFEVAFDPNSPDLKGVLDYGEIIEKTKRKTKRKNKPFLVLKVKKMGKVYSPIFVWEPHMFKAIFKNQPVIIEIERTNTFVNLKKLSYIDESVEEQAEVEIQAYYKEMEEKRKAEEIKAKKKAEKKAEIKKNEVRNKKKRLQLEGLIPLDGEEGNNE